MLRRTTRLCLKMDGRRPASVFFRKLLRCVQSSVTFFCTTQAPCVEHAKLFLNKDDKTLDVFI